MSTKKLSPQRSSLTSHHAFRVQCASVEDFKSVCARVTKDLEEEGYTVDAWKRTYETLGVGDKAKGERSIEEICERAYDTALQTGAASNPTIRLVAVFFARITREAQNALLKTLEEPPLRTKILLATPTPSALLPTIISRTIQLDNGTYGLHRDTKDEVSLVRAQTLLTLTKAKRLEQVQKIAEEKRVAEARGLILGVVTSLDGTPHTQKRLLALDKELENGAPMMKMILETAVLIAP